MLKQLLSLLMILGSMQSFAQQTETITINIKVFEKPHWTTEERQNVEMVADFVQNLMNNHNFTYVLERYGNDSYIQHNRNLPDKMSGLVTFLQDFVEDYPDYTYDVKHIYVDGNIVIFHSHATIDKSHRGNDEYGMNIIDTWRIDDGDIAEHWDAIQGLDTFMRIYALFSGGDINNENGVF